jgi:hypothetical protein
MGDVTRTIRYLGGAARAGVLVQMLEQEGVVVAWSPPREERGLAADVNDAVVQMVATGSVMAIAAAVRNFRNRVPRATVEVEVEVEGEGEGEGEDDASPGADGRARPDLTPEIELLKGVLGPRAAAVIQYAQVRYRRLRRYSDAAQEDSGLGLEEIEARVAEDERLGDLLVSGAEASVRTADEFRIRLLARVVAEAFTGSAKIDASEIRLQTLRELTSQQIQALAVLAKLDAHRPHDPDAMTKGGMRFEATQPVRRTAATIELRQHFDIGHDMAEAITAALVRHGLIYNDPPGFQDWGLTDYGRNIVEHLRGIDLEAH